MRHDSHLILLARQVDDTRDLNVTLAQFDNEYDVVYLREPIRQAPPPHRGHLCPPRLYGACPLYTSDAADESSACKRRGRDVRRQT